MNNQVMSCIEDIIQFIIRALFLAHINIHIYI